MYMYVFCVYLLCTVYINTHTYSIHFENMYLHVYIYIHIIYMCPWSTDAVISSTAIFVAITNNTLYESKL